MGRSQSQRVVIVLAFLVLLLNTSGSVADVYWAWRLARMLPTALQYDTDAHHIYIYEPTGVVLSSMYYRLQADGTCEQSVT